MTAAGAFIANGGLSEIFGSAPISSATSAVGGEVASTVVDGVTQTMSSAAATVEGALATTGQGWFDSLSTTLGEMKDAVLGFTDNMRDAWNTITTAPAAAGNEVFMQTVGTYGPKTAQFLQSITTNAFQTALQQGITWAGQTIGGTGTLVAGQLIGNPKIVGSVFSAAQSFVNSSNNFINSANNSNFLDKTFTSLDNTITAGVTGVSKWFEGLGDDIGKLGDTISWENLKNLGSPGQLVANLEANGNLGPMYEKLSAITIDQKTAQELGYNLVTSAYGVATGSRSNIGVLDLTKNITLGSLGVDLNTLARQGANLPPSLQKEIYGALGTLNPTQVNQVKAILGNTQSAVIAGTDLLDPKKLLAKSYTTLTTPVRTASVGFRAIYENESGSVNPQLNDLGEDLKGIIPDDQAVANAALSRSLLQIKGINNTGTYRLAETISSLETLKDLPLLQNQTSYVPPGVAEYWQNYYGQDYDINLGTGNFNTMVVSDVIGFAAGYNSGAPIKENSEIAAYLDGVGAFDEFTQSQGIYETIQSFSQGLFGPTEDPMMPGDWYVTIPAGWAAAGIYGPFATAIEAYEDAWINGIIPFTALANVDIYNNYPEAQQAYANDITWQDQLGREYLNRQRMDLAVTTLPATDQVAISLAQGLASYGEDTSFGGAAMWFERVVDYNSLGGQSVIAAMREGRNNRRLSDAGIQQDGAISTEGLEEPGVLLTSQYTESEANSQVIRS